MQYSDLFCRYYLISDIIFYHACTKNAPSRPLYVATRRTSSRPIGRENVSYRTENVKDAFRCRSAEDIYSYHGQKVPLSRLLYFSIQVFIAAKREIRYFHAHEISSFFLVVAALRKCIKKLCFCELLIIFMPFCYYSVARNMCIYVFIGIVGT